MKRVLIITYYWPPSGGSGVQRWLKHAKYLPEYGWQPYIFTPENPSFEVKDESLVNDIPKEVEVIKLPIWEPYSLFDSIKSKTNQQSDLVKKKKSPVNKLMRWIRGNMFIPDPRIFWVKSSVKILQDLLISNEIDTIITTGPPHSMHLIGKRLKEKNNALKWVADFRDPWTQWELFDNFYLSGWARKKHKQLEHEVLKMADAVLSVSQHYAADLEKLGDRKVEVITNGFDAAEFDTLPDEKPAEFMIRHVGVVDELRDPRPVLEAIKQLAIEGVDCPLEFVGNVNQALRAEVLSDEVLKNLIRFKPYVPHNEVLALYRNSAVLLIVLANSRNAPGNIPGKLFEYLASKRPILGIGDTKGDSARIIKESGTGQCVERADIVRLKEVLTGLREDFESGKSIDNQQIEQFTRKNLAHRLATILDQL